MLLCLKHANHSPPKDRVSSKNWQAHVFPLLSAILGKHAVCRGVRQ